MLFLIVVKKISRVNFNIILGPIITKITSRPNTDSRPKIVSVSKTDLGQEVVSGMKVDLGSHYSMTPPGFLQLPKISYLTLWSVSDAFPFRFAWDGFNQWSMSLTE